MRRLVPASLALVLLALCPLPTAAKSVKLQHVYRQGQVDRYRLTMEMTATLPFEIPNAPRPLKMSVTLDYAQKALEVWEDGSARVQTTFKDFKINIPGAPQSMGNPPKIPPVSVVTALSGSGQVLGIEGMEQMQGFPALSGMNLTSLGGQIGYYGLFPDVPVEVGQSWVSSLPFPLGGGEFNVTSTLLAAAVPVGKINASKIKQTYEGYVDLREMFRQFASAIMPGATANTSGMDSIGGAMSVRGWSVIFFSPDKGKLIKASGDIDMLMDFEMPPQAVAQGAPQVASFDIGMKIHVSPL